MSMFPHHNGLNFPPTTFPNAAPSGFSPPASVTAGYPPHLPPFYLYAHAQKALQQHGLNNNGLLDTEGMRQGPPPSSATSTSVRADRTGEDIDKDTILSNSIENLRMRARQHAASLGLTE